MEGIKMQFVYCDGGRSEAGYKGHAGDCVARSIAIAAGLPYREVYERLARETGAQRAGKRGKRAASAREGVNTSREWFRRYMAELGFTWTACMGIGTGCKVHMRPDELPGGRIIVSLSKHYAAVVDGVLFDTFDCTRAGTRCVYGYWRKA